MSRGDTPGAAPKVIYDPEPTAEDLVGMRQDDLSRRERATLATTMSTRAGAKDREAAMTLARDVGSLRPPPTDLHAGHVLETVARRRQNRHLTRLVSLTFGAALLAVGGLALSAWMTTGEWDRTHRHISIDANAVHAGQTLPLWRRGEIPADTELTLTVTTTGSGTLFVRERWGYGQVQPIAPHRGAPSGRWQVEAGEHSIIGPIRPDHVPLDVQYQAWLCPPDTVEPSIQRCRIDKVDVSWR